MPFPRHWAADHWSNGSTGFWRQFGSSAQDDKHTGAGARRGVGLRDLAYGVSRLFIQPCVSLVALRKPVLWTARAARRPFLFGSVDGRGRGAGSLRELAPSNLRGCAPDGGQAGRWQPRGGLRVLCGSSPLPRGDNQRTVTGSMRRAGLRHKCIVMAQSTTYALVRRLSWRTHN